MGLWWKYWWGKIEVRGEKLVPLALLSATNSTWTGLGLYLGLCSDRLAANVAVRIICIPQINFVDKM